MQMIAAEFVEHIQRAVRRRPIPFQRLPVVGDRGFYCRAHSVQKLNQLNWRRREIHQDKDLDKMLYLYLYSKYLDICTFLSVEKPEVHEIMVLLRK